MAAEITIIDDAELIELALFSDLAWLDRTDEDDRAPHLRSALELSHRLVLAGGGGLGLEKLRALRVALEHELNEEIIAEVAPC